MAAWPEQRQALDLAAKRMIRAEDGGEFLATVVVHAHTSVEMPQPLDQPDRCDRTKFEPSHQPKKGEVGQGPHANLLVDLAQGGERFDKKIEHFIEPIVGQIATYSIEQSYRAALAVGDHAIIWKTGKSRGKAQIVVPLLPETKALLARIKARHATDNRPLPTTVLANSRGKPWVATGFGSRFNDAKNAAGLTLHLHDLRGTFATRCMMAGLTDQEIADILGWTTKDVASIRSKYVDQARVVIALAERISRANPLQAQS